MARVVIAAIDVTLDRRSNGERSFRAVVSIIDAKAQPERRARVYPTCVRLVRSATWLSSGARTLARQQTTTPAAATEHGCDHDGRRAPARFLDDRLTRKHLGRRESRLTGFR